MGRVFRHRRLKSKELDKAADCPVWGCRSETNSHRCVLLQSALLFKSVKAYSIRYSTAKIVERLSDRSEVARYEVGNCSKTLCLSLCKTRIEHPFKEYSLTILFQIVELQLECKSPHNRRIEVVHEVRRGNHDALKILHAVQQLVHLRDLPATLCTRAVLDDPVNLVEEEDRVVGFRLLEGAANVLLRAANPHREERSPSSRRPCVQPS